MVSPELRFVQVTVPSRRGVGTYDEFRRQVDEIVGRINGAFATPDAVVIHYMYRALEENELIAMYCAADVLLVTPLRDGMNLVSKEYCACSIEEDCVLILSEFAGAAEQLGQGALLVNPHDVRAVAAAIREAYAMSPAERTARMRGMRRSIRREDVFDWVESFLKAAVARNLSDFPERSPPLDSAGP